jgi:NADPH:quinone reductase-like Zn-dependent oxidoreductase
MIIGVGAGPKTELSMVDLMQKRGTIRASTLRARPLEEKAVTARLLERSVLPLIAGGAVKVPVHATYPLDQAAEAYDAFAAGGKLGKIVLTA